MISNIQILRAVAALLVVAHHTIGTSHAYNFQVWHLNFLHNWGANGVDIFFVISGFIMVYVQSLKNRSSLDFVVDRIIRVVPIYWILTIALIGISLALPSVVNSSRDDVSWIASSLFFLSQPLHSRYPVLFLGWTLEFEMLFYSIFAVAIYFRPKISPFLFITLVITMAALLFVDTIVLEFLLGVMAGYIFQYSRLSISQGSTILVIGALLLCLTIPLENILGSEWRFLIWGLPSFLVVMGAISSRQVHFQPMSLLGDSSYSIYLIQVFTIPAYYKVASHFRLESISPDILALGCVIATALTGILSYKMLEKPMNNLLRATWARAIAPS